MSVASRNGGLYVLQPGVENIVDKERDTVVQYRVLVDATQTMEFRRNSGKSSLCSRKKVDQSVLKRSECMFIAVRVR